MQNPKLMTTDHFSNIIPANEQYEIMKKQDDVTQSTLILLGERLKSLQLEKQKLTELIQTQQREKYELKQALQMLKTKYDQLTVAKLDGDIDANRKQAEIETLSSQIEQLTKQLEIYKQTLDEHEQEIEQNTQQINELETKLEETNANLTKSRREAAIYMETIQKLEATLGQTEEQLEQLDHQHEQLNGQHNDTTNKLRQETALSHTLDNELKDAQSYAAELELQLAQLNTQHEILGGEHEKTLIKLVNTENQYNSAQNTIKELSNTNDQLNDLTDRQHMDGEELISQLEAKDLEIATKDQQIAKMAAEIEYLSSSVSKTTKTSMDLNKQLNSSQIQVCTLSDADKMNQLALEQKNEMITGLQQMQATLNAQYEQLQLEYEVLDEKYSSEQQVTLQLKDDLSTFMADLETEQRRNQQLTDELKEASYKHYDAIQLLDAKTRFCELQSQTIAQFKQEQQSTDQLNDQLMVELKRSGCQMTEQQNFYEEAINNLKAQQDAELIRMNEHEAALCRQMQDCITQQRIKNHLEPLVAPAEESLEVVQVTRREFDVIRERQQEPMFITVPDVHVFVDKLLDESELDVAYKYLDYKKSLIDCMIERNVALEQAVRDQDAELQRLQQLLRKTILQNEQEKSQQEIRGQQMQSSMSREKSLILEENRALLQRLQHERAQHEDEIAHMNADLQQIKLSLNSTSNLQQLAESRALDQSQSNVRLQTDLDGVKQAVQDEVAQNLVLKQKLEHALKQIQDLKLTEQILQREKQNVEMLAEQVKTAKEQIEQQNRMQMQAQLREQTRLEAEIDGQNLEIKRLGDDLNTYKTESAKQKQDIRQQQSEINQLVSELTEITELYQDLELQKEQLIAQLNEKTQLNHQEAADTLVQLTALEHVVQELKDENQALYRKIDDAKADRLRAEEANRLVLLKKDDTIKRLLEQ